VSLRPPKPPLLRSQSEYAGPHREDDEHGDTDDFGWGTRHGFDDHYQSEDIISQLANVSFSPLRPVGASSFPLKPVRHIAGDLEIRASCQSCVDGGCGQVQVCWIMAA